MSLGLKGDSKETWAKLIPFVLSFGSLKQDIKSHRIYGSNPVATLSHNDLPS